MGRRDASAAVSHARRYTSRVSPQPSVRNGARSIRFTTATSSSRACGSVSHAMSISRCENRIPTPARLSARWWARTAAPRSATMARHPGATFSSAFVRAGCANAIVPRSSACVARTAMASGASITTSRCTWATPRRGSNASSTTNSDVQAPLPMARTVRGSGSRGKRCIGRPRRASAQSREFLTARRFIERWGSGRRPTRDSWGEFGRNWGGGGRRC